MASKALWFEALLILLPCLSAMAKQTYLSTRYQQLPWEPQISQLTRKPPPSPTSIKGGTSRQCLVETEAELSSLFHSLISSLSLLTSRCECEIEKQNYRKRMRKANGICALRGSELRHLARHVQQDAPKHVSTETTEENNYKIPYQNESAKTLADQLGSALSLGDAKQVPAAVDPVASKTRKFPR
ncbi:hypothetical protein C1H46_038468 [Malus baccata]|uniref:Uncharacterized protein n=1 Tax=Malus baccata TaxID=106549 RepID=A0A540KP43_MALBA|nr:hypothetical protein C1H46_038468 [Malus baccata]